jgi:hypothetical protein
MIEEKTVKLFNHVYNLLLKDIKNKSSNIRSSLKINYKVFDKKSDEYLKYMNDILKENIIDCMFKSSPISTYIEVLNMEIFMNVTVNDIKKELNTNDEKTLDYYLYLLMLMVYIYRMDLDENKKDILLCSTISLADTTSLSNEEFESKCSEILDDDIKIVLKKIYDNRTGNIDFKPNTDTDSMNFDFLNNTKIGDLVKEMSSDINISSFDLPNIKDEDDSQMDITKLFENPNNIKVVSDIFQNVSKKITSKIERGELNESELMSEGVQMFGKMAGMGGLGNNQEDIIEQMANMMGKMDFSKFGDVRQNTSSTTSKNKTHSRLQKKLQDKTREPK